MSLKSKTNKAYLKWKVYDKSSKCFWCKRYTKKLKANLCSRCSTALYHNNLKSILKINKEINNKNKIAKEMQK
jgi:uncharacterized paraquat-inducible protein A